MENFCRNTTIDLHKDLVCLEHAGLEFSFYISGTSLTFGSLLPTGARDRPALAQGQDSCRELEVLITGEGRNFAARSRSLGGCGDKFQFIGIDDRQVGDGRAFVIQHFREDLGLRAHSHYFFPSDTVPVVRRWVELINEGTEPIPLEQVASAVLYHVGPVNDAGDLDALRLHVPYSSWSGEAQWQQLSLPQVGLTSLDASHYRACCLGSRSSAEKSPMAMLERVEDGRVWFWQIEHSGSWKWEIGNLFIKSHHGLYLVAGGPDEEHGHWWKQLQPGERFESVPVAVGCIDGGFERAVAALTEYRRCACKKPHRCDDTLPVIFNDYMNCLWGDPTLEAEKPLIAAASEVGCEYYCIDSGWYASPGESWWPNVGHWLPDEQRFQGRGFMALIDEIRSAGMVPGLWLEAEVVGVNNPLASRDDSWFLTRHGKRVVYNGRYFINFMNPAVIAWLDSVIDRLVSEYYIGYIKNDYNVDLLTGVENNADSFGDGLVQHIRAFYRWIDNIHRRHPALIWENCAAGGLRTDYGILSHAQLQSSSDLEQYHMYSALAIGCSATMLPEQMAVWAYPVDSDDIEQTIYNMVNALLCRIHLSGKLADMSGMSKQLITEAIACYKKIRNYIPQSVPFYPLGIPPLVNDDCWQALGMKGPRVHHLAVWRKDPQNDHCLIDLSGLGELDSVTCLYPSADRFAPKTTIIDGNKLRVVLPENKTARLLRITTK